MTAEDRAALRVLRDPRWVELARQPSPQIEQLKATITALAAHYFLVAKSADNRPVDPVARFHLGNGARLERINWLADTSEKGLREGHGLMVNYRYEFADIEKNHEAYAQDGTVAASRVVRGQLRSAAKPKGIAAVPDLLALPGIGKPKKAIPAPRAADIYEATACAMPARHLECSPNAGLAGVHYQHRPLFCLTRRAVWARN